MKVHLLDLMRGHVGREVLLIPCCELEIKVETNEISLNMRAAKFQLNNLFTLRS